MNLPNQLTCARLVLTVVFLYCIFLSGALFKGISLLIFLLASFTDYLDGKIARERGLITNFGKLMDPIADKALTLSAFISFVQLGIIPAWMTIVIIARDLAITSFRLTVPMPSESQSAQASGKQKTAMQFASIVGILIYLWLRETAFWKPEWTPMAEQFIYFGMLFIVAITLWSGVQYILKNKRWLFTH